jgi:hypothetical protein
MDRIRDQSHTVGIDPTCDLGGRDQQVDGKGDQEPGSGRVFSVEPMRLYRVIMLVRR